MKILLAFVPLIFFGVAALKGHYTHDGPTVLHILVVTVIFQLFVITLTLLDK